MAKNSINPLSKYTPSLAIDIYRWAKSGNTNEEIAKKCHIAISTFNDRWRVNYPETEYALEQGRKDRKEEGEKGGSLVDYVYERLSPELRRVWDEIEFWQEHAQGPEKIEGILGKESVKVRQHLWMHAMLVSDFNGSDACRMVNISKRTLDKWLAEDPDFPALVDELNYHKKNFFESQMIRMGKAFSEKAVIHANKTLNRDRGYGEKISVEHSGSVQHNHLMIPLERLDLDVDTLLKIETAMQRLAQREEKNVTPVQALTAGTEASTGGEDDGDDEDEE